MFKFSHVLLAFLGKTLNLTSPYQLPSTNSNFRFDLSIHPPVLTFSVEIRKALTAREIEMPHVSQSQVMDADDFLDPSTEADDAPEEEESGALQDALLEGDEDDEVEGGMCLELQSYTPICPLFTPFHCGLPQNASSFSTLITCTCELLCRP